MNVTEGRLAPAFTLNDADGNKFALHEQRGRDLIIYFYPSDETPGCTKQACSFRDLWEQFCELDINVAGISPNDGQSHRSFIENHRLPFTLLCDPDKKVMQKYGAFGEKMMYGKTVTGVIRSTVWVASDGKVVKHWAKVARAADHPAKVLQAVLETR